VIDVAPTVLEAAQLPEPKSVNGVAQAPIEGVSMAYSFDKADAASTHRTQYFEIFGNRAIYSDGWFAGTIHRAPWEPLPRRKLQEDVWELYDTRKDFSLVDDVAGSNPANRQDPQGRRGRETDRRSHQGAGGRRTARGRCQAGIVQLTGRKG
jgi:arylsulfatase